jgi:gas vesicle protein
LLHSPTKNNHSVSECARVAKSNKKNREQRNQEKEAKETRYAKTNSIFEISTKNWSRNISDTVVEQHKDKVDKK